MKINCLAPIFDGSEGFREQMFGSRDQQRVLPTQTHPFWERRQEDQGRTNMCTVYQYLEILENKVFWATGEWYNTPQSEIDRLWDRVKKEGYGSDATGAYMNGINKVMEEDQVVLTNTRRGLNHKKVVVKQKDWFIVANKAMSPDEFEKAVLNELAYGHGLQYGLVTQQARLGYVEADKAPYIVEPNRKPEPIAHATALTGYDFNKKPNLIASSGSWGESFGDKGVVWYNLKDLRKGFTPIGFSVTIL